MRDDTRRFCAINRYFTGDLMIAVVKLIDVPHVLAIFVESGRRSDPFTHNHCVSSSSAFESNHRPSLSSLLMSLQVCEEHCTNKWS